MVFSFSTCRLVLLVSAVCNAMTSAELTVNLGGAGDYAILAKSGISTVADSTISGDIGASPIAATAMTGFSFSVDSGGEFATSAQVAGKAYSVDYAAPTPAELTTSVSAMEAAYTDAASRHPGADRINIGGGILGGVNDGGPTKLLTPGVYTFDTDDVHLTADVHFSGAGVYIIQMTGNLVQAANCNVILEDGAKPENIFWQVAGFVQVGADAHMEGIILAKTSVDFITGSSLNGRVLTQTACNLDTATITEPDTEPINELASIFKLQLINTNDDENHVDLFVDLFVESYNELVTEYDDPFHHHMDRATTVEQPGGRRLGHPQQESRQLQNNNILLFLRATGSCNGCGDDNFTGNQVRRHRKLQDVLLPGVPSQSELFDAYSALLNSSSGDYVLLGLEELS
jgi:hypothetical protein